MKTMIAPSIFAADLTDLVKAVNKAENTADMLHCDVMDGVFVPNISFGQKTVKDINAITDMPLDVHLMITQPERYIDEFIDCGADYLTFHYEATALHKEIIDRVKSRGVKVGMSIKPSTPVEVLFPFLCDLDLILIMSVEPGFSGQKFMPEVLSKVKTIKPLMRCDALLEIDGGINGETRVLAEQAGCNLLVMGSAFFK